MLTFVDKAYQHHEVFLAMPRIVGKATALQVARIMANALEPVQGTVAAAVGDGASAQVLLQQYLLMGLEHVRELDDRQMRTLIAGREVSKLAELQRGLWCNGHLCHLAVTDCTARAHTNKQTQQQREQRARHGGAAAIVAAAAAAAAAGDAGEEGEIDDVNAEIDDDDDNDFDVDGDCVYHADVPAAERTFIERMRRAVGRLRKSSTLLDALEAGAETVGSGRIKPDGATRWSSLHSMFVQLSRAKATLQKLTRECAFDAWPAASRPPYLQAEFDMLTDITAALAPVKVFSEFVQRRAPAQMPALISQYHAMEQALGARSGDFAAALLRRVRARIGARLVERENLAIVAAAMHPDFAPTLLDSVSAELVHSTLAAAAVEAHTYVEMDVGDERVRHDEQAVDEFGLVAVPESRHVLKLNVLEEEFQQAWSFFRMQKKPNWSPNKFLDWWGAHGSKKYPNIAPFVVFVAAAVPVASANCESMFSYSGATLTKTRNRLSPEHLEQLTILKHFIDAPGFDKETFVASAVSQLCGVEMSTTPAGGAAGGK